MDYYLLIIGVLGVWRITHLLHAEDGPWDIFARLRSGLQHTVAGRMMDCFYCLSLSIAAPFSWLIGMDGELQFLLWPALSAGAILFEKIHLYFADSPTALHWEDKTEEHELL